VSAYYNEFDKKTAAWLRELIKRGLIADGEVDDRSIAEVTPDDVKGFDQCHFFAGIGGWSYALRLAGWPDTGRNVWTGSPPCQPFSAAGKGAGVDDPRHLWPAYFDLIRQCRPATLYGEQVAAAIGFGWLDDVQDALEGEGYAFAKIVLPACSVGAPHLRQRLWFVAESNDTKRRAGVAGGHDIDRHPPGRQQGDDNASEHSEPCFVADTHAEGRQRDGRQFDRSDERDGWCQSPQRGIDGAGVEGLRAAGELGDTNNTRSQEREREESNGSPREEGRPTSEPGSAFRPCEFCGYDGGEFDEEYLGRYGCPNCNGEGFWPETNFTDPVQANPWESLEWLPCADGKARPTQPGIFPLAHGVSGRTMALRGAGNAIVPQVAAQVIGAYMEIVQ
jgi:DNA (cytosine-5)-methyltransferase 1